MFALLGYIGWIMVFIGVWKIGSKDVRGFYWHLAAEIVLIVDAIMFAHWSLLFACSIFAIVYIRNIIKWKKDDS